MYFVFVARFNGRAVRRSELTVASGRRRVIVADVSFGVGAVHWFRLDLWF